MNNTKEIEDLSELYLANTDGTDARDGFVYGFEVCRNEIAQIIKDNPNDQDLGGKLRSIFVEKGLL